MNISKLVALLLTLACSNLYAQENNATLAVTGSEHGPAARASDAVTQQLDPGHIVLSGSLSESGVLLAGPLCIGTNQPGTVLWSQTQKYKLAVNGSIRARELVIEDQVGDWKAWPDYVFAPEYQLMPLDELEAWINTHRHLPGIPSANEVATNGVAVGEMQRLLLEKIEELTLRVIELSKQNEVLARKLEAR
jgi:hypothetical protein